MLLEKNLCSWILFTYLNKNYPRNPARISSSVMFFFFVQSKFDYLPQQTGWYLVYAIWARTGCRVEIKKSKSYVEVAKVKVEPHDILFFASHSNTHSFLHRPLFVSLIISASLCHKSMLETRYTETCSVKVAWYFEWCGGEWGGHMQAALEGVHVKKWAHSSVQTHSSTYYTHTKAIQHIFTTTTESDVNSSNIESQRHEKIIAAGWGGQEV